MNYGDLQAEVRYGRPAGQAIGRETGTVSALARFVVAGSFS
jgi:hypothetical protein